MNGIERILVAIDFSKSSKTTLRRAATLADTCGATLEMAHAIRSSPWANIGPSASEARDEAEWRLDEFVTDVAQLTRIKAEKSVLEGSPATVLAERARTSDADLIIVGAHGRHFLRDLFVEPTAITLLRQHAKPVLMVKREPRRDYQRVLVATDFSAVAQAAAETAARITQRAELIAFHVYETMYERQMLYANCAPETIDRYRALGEMEAVRRMTDLINATEQMRRFIGTVRHGHAPRQILEYAEAVHADLLVLGIPSRSAISSMLFSSVTAQLVQTSSPDLLLVPGNKQ